MEVIQIMVSPCFRSWGIPRQDSSGWGLLKGVEINHSGDSFREHICFEHERKPVACDWLAHYLGLNSERSHPQGLYAEDAHKGDMESSDSSRTATSFFMLLESPVFWLGECGAPCFLFRIAVRQVGWPSGHAGISSYAPTWNSFWEKKEWAVDSRTNMAEPQNSWVNEDIRKNTHTVVFCLREGLKNTNGVLVTESWFAVAEGRVREPQRAGGCQDLFTFLYSAYKCLRVCICCLGWVGGVAGVYICANIPGCRLRACPVVVCKVTPVSLSIGTFRVSSFAVCLS